MFVSKILIDPAGEVNLSRFNGQTGRSLRITDNQGGRDECGITQSYYEEPKPLD